MSEDGQHGVQKGQSLTGRRFPAENDAGKERVDVADVNGFHGFTFPVLRVTPRVPGTENVPDSEASPSVLPDANTNAYRYRLLFSWVHLFLKSSLAMISWMIDFTPYPLGLRAIQNGISTLSPVAKTRGRAGRVRHQLSDKVARDLALVLQ